MGGFFFAEHGKQARHWSEIGPATARDEEILAWAKGREAIVFTHDLDFGALLAAGGLQGPSVIQLRSASPLPETCGAVVLAALQRFHEEVAQGALLSVDEGQARARLLPLR